ncbi:hypothetical protein [Bacillus toyonensis]|uniref:hypothetical protein n=1 Tax=Bacillus toyonensis TaxID=155322 RepID=UPI0001A0C5A6|nr:hypothetical protein [Bacillus toyonensis]AFU16332.1 hypothetical protein MC28_4910 [Bacillus thuringiensis MC28]EEL36490.1 hypothetical protein bcere0019_2090 [Bacillus cereus Rock3-28]MBJ7949488.1 hypothetical protein [Bacillus cereus group sp. N24]MDF9450090.1 hypothetical protein [Bacillus toyonensis]MEE2020599.1 hypothetical protein [Bacillus toyonensis]
MKIIRDLVRREKNGMRKEEVVRFPIKDFCSYFTVAVVCIGLFDIITNLIVK